MAETTHAVARALGPYVGLFRDFLDQAIDASTFVDQFTRSYLADPTQWSPDVFDVLDGVFASADAYEPDDVLRPEVIGAIDEYQLRVQVHQARISLAGSSSP